MRQRRTCCAFLKTCLWTFILVLVLTIFLFGGRNCHVVKDNTDIINTNIVNIVVTETNHIDVISDIFVTNYVDNIINVTNEVIVVKTNYVTEVKTNYIDVVADIVSLDKTNIVEEIVLLDYGIMTIIASNDTGFDGISHVSLSTATKRKSNSLLYRNNGIIITNHKKYMYWMREDTHEKKEIKGFVYLQEKN